LGIVFPQAQTCARIGDAKSTSLVTLISLSSARSAVWPPPVEAVALLGWVMDQLTEVHSIQAVCFESVDSPLMPSSCR